MAWFLNHYRCARCARQWTDQWSCLCDDDCPHCGARQMPPHASEELTTLIEQDGRDFVVRWSPETAADDPDYRELGRFASREQALAFLGADGPDRAV
jgi:predicted  nucleic acid-binding Zn-ribbon protein